MKKVVIISLLIFALVCSCGTHSNSDRTYYESPESVFVEDRNWTDTMALYGVWANPDKSAIVIYGGLNSESSINVRIEDYFTLPIERPRTDAENYAIERISERNQVFKDYYSSLIKNTQIHHNVANICIRDTPKVYADKDLFGKGQGEDISSFFSVASTSALFRCSGPDYRVLEAGRGVGFLLCDYYSKGVMMPLRMYFKSTIMPEELTMDYNVTLTFVFPVTIEHYWSWLLEQYSNPDAMESFVDTDMILKVHISGDMESHDWI